MSEKCKHIGINPCTLPEISLLGSSLGMLIPGKPHSRDKSRNSGVSIETLDFARVHTFTCVIGVGSPAGARRGGGAITGWTRRRSRLMTGSPPAGDQHSPQMRTQNGRGRVRGECDRGRATAIGPRRWAGESPPPPVGRRKTVGQRCGRDGHVKRRAVAGSPVPWRTCQNQTCSATQGRNRRLDAGCGRLQAHRWTRPDDWPTLRVVGTFDVCSNAAVNCDLSCCRLKWQYLHCRADSVA